MWLIGSGVQASFHGTPPSLGDLDEGDLRMTTDFRRVYASVLSEWIGVADPAYLLRGNFRPLGLRAASLPPT
jgi:uncharacterized protein (DUF1501 family)